MSFGARPDDSFSSMGGDSRGDARIPELYPPRVLPKVLKKKPRHLETYRVLNDKFPFSGFHIESHSNPGQSHRVRYTHVVGKQDIYDELDLQVILPANSTTATDAASSSSNTACQSQTLSGDQHNLTISQLNGSAMASFPAEIRRFFPKLGKSGDTLPTQDNPIVRATTLGPFVPKTRESTPPDAVLDHKKRALIKTGAQQSIDASLRAPRKYKTTLDPHAKEKAGNKKIRMSKLRGGSNASSLLGEDDDEQGVPDSKRNQGDINDDGDDDSADSDNDFAYSDDDLDSDGDYGVVYDDDDEDGNDMLAGGDDDEPVF